MLTYCQFGPSSVNLVSKYQPFAGRKCIWKCRLQNGGHFVSASSLFYRRALAAGDHLTHFSDLRRCCVPEIHAGQLWFIGFHSGLFDKNVELVYYVIYHKNLDNAVKFYNTWLFSRYSVNMSWWAGIESKQEWWYQLWGVLMEYTGEFKYVKHFQ